MAKCSATETWSNVLSATLEPGILSTKALFSAYLGIFYGLFALFWATVCFQMTQNMTAITSGKVLGAFIRNLLQIRNKYNPNLISDDETEVDFQMRQRALRAQKIAKRQFGQRATGLMPVRSFLSRVGTSMTNLVSLGRNRRNGAPRTKTTDKDKIYDRAMKDHKTSGNTAAERAERARKISRESSKLRISMIHAGSLSSMAEEGVEDVVKFNATNGRWGSVVWCASNDDYRSCFAPGDQKHEMCCALK